MEDIECYNQSLIDMKEQLMEKMLRCFWRLPNGI
jgi:hypothetical protein